MARSHGRILASIWTDPEFIRLDGEAQRVYMLLLSQPNLTHAGTLPLTIKRWSRLSGDSDEAAMLATLRRLSTARFVVVDGETEELLVRTLIRNDGVFKQPKVLRAASNDLKAVTSPKLRRALRLEVVQCPIDEVTEKAREEVAGILKEMAEALDTPPDDPNGGLPDTPAEALPVAVAKPPRSARAPSPALSPAPAPTPAVSDGALRAAEPDTAGTLIAEYLAQCRKRPPRQFLAALGRTVKHLLAEPIDPDDVRDGLVILLDRGLNPSALPGAVNEAMNAGRRARAPADGLSENSRAHLALVAEVRAEQQKEIS